MSASSAQVNSDGWKVEGSDGLTTEGSWSPPTPGSLHLPACRCDGGVCVCVQRLLDEDRSRSKPLLAAWLPRKQGLWILSAALHCFLPFSFTEAKSERQGKDGVGASLKM